MGRDGRKPSAVGRGFGVAAPYSQSDLPEWFVGLRSQVQRPVRKAADCGQSKIESPKTCETPVQQLDVYLANFAWRLKWIEQSDVRRHSGCGRGVVSGAERPNEFFGRGHQNDQS